jgi:hypothetical protein
MISFGQKKVLNTKFSLQDMAKIQDRAEARKYFITQYFVPMAYTMWQNGIYSNKEWAILHMCREASGRMFPYIFFATEDLNKLLSVASWPTSAQLTEQADFYKKIAATNDVGDFSEQINRAFGECFYSYGSNQVLATSPLVASIQKMPVGGNAETCNLKLNITTRTVGTTKVKSTLRSQIYSRTCFELNVISQKYRRLYSAITGEWESLCEDPECKDCPVIRQSIAAANAYDDPDVVLEAEQMNA